MTLRQRIEYGDGGDPHQDDAARAEARSRNLLGQSLRSYDEAGLVVSGGFNFKGNPLQTMRQVIADAPILATYTDAATHGWQVAPFTVDWTPAVGQSQDARDAELLDAAGYTHATNTSRRAVTWPCTQRPIWTRSPPNSTTAPGSDSAIHGH